MYPPKFILFDTLTLNLISFGDGAFGRKLGLDDFMRLGPL